MTSVVGIVLALAVSQDAEARKLAVVITENEGLSARESQAALNAALDILTGNVDLGDAPEKVTDALKARGSDPVKCGGDAVCIANLGTELSTTYVLALGIGSVAGDYPLSATLVDVAHQKVVSRKAVVLPSKPEWPEAVRDLLRQTLPEGVIRYESRLKVTVDVASAEVFIDGHSVGTTPLAKPVPVTAGSHDIRVEKAGYRTFNSSLDVEPTGTNQIEVKLPLLPPPEVPSPYRPVRLAAFGTGALTAIGIGFSIAFQLKLNDASNAFVQTCKGWAVDPTPCTNGGAIVLPPGQQAEYARLQQLQANTSAAQTRLAVSLGLTIAVAATTAVLVFYDFTHGPAPVTVSLGPASAVVTGRF